MSKRYLVSIDVIYTSEVEAENEDEAINKVIEECPYDNDDNVEAFVKEQERWE